MVGSVVNWLLVAAGVGITAWFWHGVRHWAVGPFAIFFGAAVALGSLAASGLVAVAFSGPETWDPLVRPKTFAAVVIGATIVSCGALLSLAYAVRGLWLLFQRRHRA
jgi:hypothetical protein